MKPKKGNLKKPQRTQSEEITEVKNEFKNEEPTYQILGNAGGDYIKTTLPKDFYENVILGEMSLEFDFSIEKLTNLTDLYSLGIQYYLENNPIQAKHFQDRMGYILTNKDVLFKLKKQQEEEKKEKENSEKKVYPKSARNLPQVSMRKRARTNFIVKSKNINSDEIQKKVSFVLKDTDKEKEEKENVKSIIKEEFNKQNLNWKERLKYKKTSFGSGIRLRNRTFMAKSKKFQTPGPIQGRGVMTLKSPNGPKSPSQDNHPLGFKKRENMRNKHYMNFIDNESSEMDELEKNEGDLDFMKQFKEKHYSKEEENKDNKDNKDKDNDDKDEDNDNKDEENLNIEKESNENQIKKKSEKKKK